MAKTKSDYILSEPQLTEYQPVCIQSIVSLQGQERELSPTGQNCPPPPSLLPSPVLAGVGNVTYVEFFILCDNFSIGEDGGRRAFGEWISWKDKSRQVDVRASLLGHMVIH